MPRYEYQCEGCGAGVELSRSIAERNDSVICELCTNFMVMVPSLTSFSLKGPGWTPKGFEPSTAIKPKRRPIRGSDMTGDRDL